VTSDSGPVFAKFLTPAPDLGSKMRRILPQSTPAPRPLLALFITVSAGPRCTQVIKAKSRKQLSLAITLT